MDRNSSSLDWWVHFIRKHTFFTTFPLSMKWCSTLSIISPCWPPACWPGGGGWPWTGMCWDLRWKLAERDKWQPCRWHQLMLLLSLFFKTFCKIQYFERGFQVPGHSSRHPLVRQQSDQARQVLSRWAGWPRCEKEKSFARKSSKTLLYSLVGVLYTLLILLIHQSPCKQRCIIL